MLISVNIVHSMSDNWRNNVYSYIVDELSPVDCNRQVEDQILKILRQRRLDCLFYYQYEPDIEKYCKKQTDDYFTAETNWFAKCKQFHWFALATQNRHKVQLLFEV